MAVVGEGGEKLTLCSWNVQSGKHSGVVVEEADHWFAHRFESARRVIEVETILSVLPHVDAFVGQEADYSIVQQLLEEKDKWSSEFDLIVSSTDNLFDPKQDDPIHYPHLFPSSNGPSLELPREKEIPFRLIDRVATDAESQEIIKRVCGQQEIVISKTQQPDVYQLHFLQRMAPPNKGFVYKTEKISESSPRGPVFARLMRGDGSAQAEARQIIGSSFYYGCTRPPSSTNQAELRKGMIALVRKSRNNKKMADDIAQSWQEENCKEFAKPNQKYNALRSTLQPVSVITQTDGTVQIVVNVHVYRPDGDNGEKFIQARTEFEKLVASKFQDKILTFTYMGDTNCSKTSPDPAYHVDDLTVKYANDLKTAQAPHGANSNPDQLIVPPQLPVKVGVPLGVELSKAFPEESQRKHFILHESLAISENPVAWVISAKSRLTNTPLLRIDYPMDSRIQTGEEMASWLRELPFEPRQLEISITDLLSVPTKEVAGPEELEAKAHSAEQQEIPVPTHPTESPIPPHEDVRVDQDLRKTHQDRRILQFIDKIIFE